MSRTGYVATACAAVLVLGALPWLHIAPKLIWNASASVPIGLYRIAPAGHLTEGELVAARPPKPLARFLAENGYLPQGVPLMKHVAALPGHRVCRIRRAITVDGVALGEALDRDRRGRPLPVWRGCRRVQSGEIFLMNGTVRDSLDGRYFGPLPAASIIGRAIPLWIDRRGDPRDAGHAPAR